MSSGQEITLILLGSLIPFAAIGVLFHFIIIRPRNQRKANTKLVATDPDDPFTLWSVPEEQKPKQSMARGCFNVFAVVMFFFLSVPFVGHNLYYFIGIDDGVVYVLVAFGLPILMTLGFSYVLNRIRIGN